MMQPRDQLTAKEIQVSTLVRQGLTNREIAKIIGTTEQVVKNYLRTSSGFGAGSSWPCMWPVTAGRTGRSRRRMKLSPRLFQRSAQKVGRPSGRPG